MRDAYAARSFYLHRKYVRRRDALSRDGALFIAVSRCVRDALWRRVFRPARTVTQHIGVDVDGFVPDPASSGRMWFFSSAGSMSSRAASMRSAPWPRSSAWFLAPSLL